MSFFISRGRRRRRAVARRVFQGGPGVGGAAPGSLGVAGSSRGRGAPSAAFASGALSAFAGSISIAGVAAAGGGLLGLLRLHAALGVRRSAFPELVLQSVLSAPFDE